MAIRWWLMERREKRRGLPKPYFTPQIYEVVQRIFERLLNNWDDFYHKGIPAVLFSLSDIEELLPELERYDEMTLKELGDLYLDLVSATNKFIRDMNKAYIMFREGRKWLYRLSEFIEFPTKGVRPPETHTPRPLERLSIKTIVNDLKKIIEKAFPTIDTKVIKVGKPILDDLSKAYELVVQKEEPEKIQKGLLPIIMDALEYRNNIGVFFAIGNGILRRARMLWKKIMDYTRKGGIEEQMKIKGIAPPKLVVPEWEDDPEFGGLEIAI